MKKLITTILVVFASAGLAVAQFTTVTGTVTDANGLPYAFGTIAPTLVVTSSSQSPTICSTGQTYTPPSQPTGLDSKGKFTLSIANNASICPAGSQWTFRINCGTGCVIPAIGTGPQSFAIGPLTIAGASQDLTATIAAVPPPALSLIATTLPTQAADTVTANFTGAVASPIGVPMPTGGTNGCSGATDALNYNTTTHTLGCTTIAVGTGTVTATSPAVGAYPDFTSTGLTPNITSSQWGNYLDPDFPTCPISTISRASNVVTVTCTGQFAILPVGYPVRVTGVTDASYNGGPFTILTITNSSQTYTYAQTGANSSSSGGNVNPNLGGNIPANAPVFISRLGNPVAFMFTSPSAAAQPYGSELGLNFIVSTPLVNATGGGNINFWAGDSVGSSSAPGGSVNFNLGQALGMTPASNGTFNIANGKLIAAASNTNYASLNLPPGSAPSSPADGDCWITTTGLFCRINGTTVGPYNTGSGSVTGTINQVGVFSATNVINGQNTITNAQLPGGGTNPSLAGTASIAMAGQTASLSLGNKTLTLTTNGGGGTNFQLVPNSSGATVFEADGGFQVTDLVGMTFGSPTGGAKGTETLNTAGNIYVNGNQVPTLATNNAFSADNTFYGTGSPFIDVTGAGIRGDVKLSKTINWSTTSMTASTATFASGDCQTGGGCTGTSNKVIAVNGGGYGAATFTVGAPTGTSTGNLTSNITYFLQYTEIQDNATLPANTINGVVQPAVNTWSSPTTEASFAIGANTSFTLPTPASNMTGATGWRIYATGANAPSANSGEEVLQTPGLVAFGTVTAGGSGCVAGNLTGVTAPSQAGGVQATGHYTCSAGALNAIIIDNPGSGYTANPSCGIATGTGTCTLTVGLLCGSQSAKNFHDLACDIIAGATVNSQTFIGPLVPGLLNGQTSNEFRTVITAFTSPTSVTVADTVITALAGNTSWTAYGTENTSLFATAQGKCNQPTPAGGAAGCALYFPPSGSVNAPTGRFLFLNGLQVFDQNVTVFGFGSRPGQPNAGNSGWTGQKQSPDIVNVGDAWGIQLGTLQSSVNGELVRGIGTDDILNGAGWGGLGVFGLVGNGGSDHIQIDDVTASDYINGPGLGVAETQVLKSSNFWCSPCRIGFRAYDNNSDISLVEPEFGGAIASSGSPNNLAGLGVGSWISSNPLSNLGTGFGNVRMIDPTFRDYYQGMLRVTDSGQNRVYGGKYENIALTGFASCAGSTTCTGYVLREEGIVSTRCNNNLVRDISVIKVANIFDSPVSPVAGGTVCSSADVENVNVTTISGNICVQGTNQCQTNDTTAEVNIGNGGNGKSFASSTPSGIAYGPDILCPTGSCPNSMTPDCSKGNVHVARNLVAGANVMNNPINCQDGQQIIIEAVQDATGNRQLGWGANYQGSTNVNTAASAITVFEYVWDNANSKAVRQSTPLPGTTSAAVIGTSAASNVAAQVMQASNTTNAGMYHLDIYANQDTACTTNTTGATTVQYAYKDSSGTTQTVAAGTMTWTTATPLASFRASVPIFAVASSQITVSTTASTQCATGTTTYDLHAALTQVQ